MGGHLRVAREVGSYKVAGYTLKLVTLFFFSWLRRRKRKRTKKRSAVRRISRVATRDQGYAPWMGASFCKSLPKLLNGCREVFLPRRGCLLKKLDLNY